MSRVDDLNAITEDDPSFRTPSLNEVHTAYYYVDSFVIIRPLFIAKVMPQYAETKECEHQTFLLYGTGDLPVYSEKTPLPVDPHAQTARHLSRPPPHLY